MAASFDTSRIMEFFLIEAGGHLQTLNRGILSLEKAPFDRETIDELFRAARTLEGTAAVMGFPGVSDVAYKAQDILGRFRAGTLPLCRETLNLLFDGVDALKILMAGVAANQPEDTLVTEGIGRAYREVLERFPKTPAVPQAGSFASMEGRGRSSSQSHKDNLDLAWEQTFDLAAGRTVANDANPANGNPPLQRITDAGESDCPEKRGAGSRAADAADDLESRFVRVTSDRLDSLMDLVGEMSVSRNRLVRQADFITSLREALALSQRRLLHEINTFENKGEHTLSAEAPEFDRHDDFNLLSRTLKELTNDTNEIMTELAGIFAARELESARFSSITTSLRDEIAMARTVEMNALYCLCRQPVGDLAQEEGKRVNLTVTGGETRIDKTTFEIFSDPFLHMIRNAVSHGIEPEAERKVLGKDLAGMLILQARREGNVLVLQIEDDGRGMDPAALRKSAVENGLMTAAEVRSLTDQEAIDLIFRPGFSTATKIGAVAGRGVGMDVVSTRLAQINGRIEIKTEKGVGTKLVITLPLTQPIAQALIVRLADRELAVPMNQVEQTTRFSSRDIQRSAGEERVKFRGGMVRLFKLNELLGVGAFPKKEKAFCHPTLILGMAEKRIAIMVEDIIGREEIVVKSLGDYLKGVTLFSGATISGEGNVRLVLNSASLFGGGATAAIKPGRVTAPAPAARTRSKNC
jgi:chemotaxis protein histidine kinase CheA